jgi:leader peptidase (prepilin peptidase)/N-methyltransferase
MPTPHLAQVLLSSGLALAASPLLSSWTTALLDEHQWWRPRRVHPRQWAPVAGVAVVFAALAGAATPWPAWWLLAAAGSALTVVDLRAHILPARLVYPLAATELVTLLAAALIDGQPGRLVRVALAAAVVASCWFAVAFASPASLGLGDVRVAGLGAGLLGWHSWGRVLDGQLAACLLTLLLAVVLAAVHPTHRSWRTPVPMGPALIAGALLAAIG